MEYVQYLSRKRLLTKTEAICFLLLFLVACFFSLFYLLLSLFVLSSFFFLLFFLGEGKEVQEHVVLLCVSEMVRQYFWFITFLYEVYLLEFLLLVIATCTCTIVVYVFTWLLACFSFVCWCPTTARSLIVLQVLFLPYWSFQLYISLRKSPSALT